MTLIYQDTTAFDENGNSDRDLSVIDVDQDLADDLVTGGESWPDDHTRVNYEYVNNYGFHHGDEN